ncbi:MAG: hypothetical protein ACOZCO_16605 [Bacteroidota bacterium]
MKFKNVLIILVAIVYSCSEPMNSEKIEPEFQESEIYNDTLTERKKIDSFKNRLNKQQPFYLNFWNGMSREYFEIALDVLVEDSVLDEQKYLPFNTNKNKYLLTLNPNFTESSQLVSIQLDFKIKSKDEFKEVYDLYFTKYGKPVTHISDKTSIFALIDEGTTNKKNEKGNIHHIPTERDFNLYGEQTKDHFYFYDKSIFVKENTHVMIQFYDRYLYDELINYDLESRYTLMIYYRDATIIFEDNLKSVDDVQSKPTKHELERTKNSI